MNYFENILHLVPKYSSRSFYTIGAVNIFGDKNLKKKQIVVGRNNVWRVGRMDQNGSVVRKVFVSPI